MTFDSSRAWSQASQAVSANREVVLALAGVFFLLPQLVLGIFFPAPETTAGMNEQQMMAVLQKYYLSVAPIMIPMMLAQAMGTMSLLSLLDTARRPTVSGAMRAGLKGLLPYLGAQILSGVGLGALALLLMGVLGAAGGGIGVAIGLAITVLAAAAIAVRLSITGPVIALEHTFNPAAALVRSWKLTKGSTARLLGFYVLLGIAMLVLIVFTNVLTIPLALILPVTAARLVSAVVESLITAVVGVYFVAVVAQVHRQLAGPSSEAVSGTFE